MLDDLVRIHHGQYQEDLPFWHAVTRGREPILELGCGHGRVMVSLGKAGRRIVGLDSDPRALASLRASLEGWSTSPLEVVQADMLSIPFPTIFEAVIIPCNTYSTFSAGERVRLLRGIKRCLVPGGTLSASLPNPVLMEEIHRELSGESDQAEPDVEAVFPHPQTGNPVQVSSQLFPGPETLTWEWIYDHLLPDGRVERSTRSTLHTLASLEVYQEEIEGAGFQVLSLQGDFSGSTYQQDSPYLIWQATAG
jgi:SAM-dependent methyltransferase